MTTLNVLIIHLSAPEVDEHVAALRAIAPDSRFVVAYGGDRSEFARIREPDKAFVADPSWRGPPRSYQSYNQIFQIVHDRWLQLERELDACFVFEFDHLILRAEFEPALREVSQRTGADLLGKNCVVANGTNWHHYTRFRRDPALHRHLRSVSMRDDPSRLYGTVASGLWLTRAAIASFVSVSAHPACYGELYVPTLLHHLGHRVVDIDSVSRLYDSVRWEPEYSATEVTELQRRGATFVHPVKDPLARGQALAAAST